jgi:glycerol uptake facilitator-like aquaporin
MGGDKDSSYVRMSYSQEAAGHDEPVEAQLKSHWTRTLATEFFGSFICNIITCGVINTVYFADVDAILKIHDHQVFPNGATFSFPLPYLLVSVGVGLAFVLGLMVAPEATLNPAFTFAMTLGGVKPASLFFPAVIGQFFGKLLGALVIYSAGHQYFLGDNPIFHKSVDVMGTNYAMLYGFTPPGDMISNGMCCWNSMIFTALLICVVIPAALKNPDQMPVVVGLTVTSFAAAQAAFGVINDPLSQLVGAMACTIAGFPAADIWGFHGGFLWAATLGPTLGVILGVSVFRVYAYLVWEAPK